MVSNGKGKRSASAARLDDQGTPASVPDDAASQLNAMPFGHENKRPCYPDPSPYQDMPHPQAPQGYDFNQPNYFDNQASFDLFGQHSGFNNNSLEQQYGNYNPMNFQTASSPFVPYAGTPVASPFSAGISFGPPQANNPLGQHQNTGHPGPKLETEASCSLALPKPESTSPSATAGFTIGPASSTPKATPPVTRSRTRNGTSKMAGTLRIGGVSIEDAGLKIPDLPADESLRRKGELSIEIEHQRQNPPALPRSRIVDLEEKPRHAPWHDIPDDCVGKERDRLVQLNNQIATQNQKIERDRNNQAAKKSRQKRLEALTDTRRILNEKSAECDWWRMRAMTLGASAREWEQVPRHIKATMAKEISERVDVVHQCHEEEKKKEDAVKRTERNKTRSRGARNSTPVSSS